MQGIEEFSAGVFLGAVLMLCVVVIFFISTYKHDDMTAAKIDFALKVCEPLGGLFMIEANRGDSLIICQNNTRIVLPANYGE